MLLHISEQYWTRIIISSHNFNKLKIYYKQIIFCYKLTTITQLSTVSTPSDYEQLVVSSAKIRIKEEQNIDTPRINSKGKKSKNR